MAQQCLFVRILRVVQERQYIHLENLDFRKSLYLGARSGSEDLLAVYPRGRFGLQRYADALGAYLCDSLVVLLRYLQRSGLQRFTDARGAYLCGSLVVHLWYLRFYGFC